MDGVADGMDPSQILPSGSGRRTRQTRGSGGGGVQSPKPKASTPRGSKSAPKAKPAQNAITVDDEDEEEAVAAPKTKSPAVRSHSTPKKGQGSSQSTPKKGQGSITPSSTRSTPVKTPKKTTRKGRKTPKSAEVVVDEDDESLPSASEIPGAQPQKESIDNGDSDNAISSGEMDIEEEEEPGSDVDHETLDAFTMAESKITSAENNAIFEADTIDDIEDPASAYRLGTARVCVTALNREWPENTVFDKVRQRPILPHHVENLVADFERRGVNRISEPTRLKISMSRLEFDLRAAYSESVVSKRWMEAKRKEAPNGDIDEELERQNVRLSFNRAYGTHIAEFGHLMLDTENFKAWIDEQMENNEQEFFGRFGLEKEYIPEGATLDAGQHRVEALTQFYKALSRREPEDGSNQKYLDLDEKNGSSIEVVNEELLHWVADIYSNDMPKELYMLVRQNRKDVIAYASSADKLLHLCGLVGQWDRANLLTKIKNVSDMQKDMSNFCAITVPEMKMFISILRAEKLKVAWLDILNHRWGLPNFVISDAEKMATTRVNKVWIDELEAMCNFNSKLFGPEQSKFVTVNDQAKVFGLVKGQSPSFSKLKELFFPGLSNKETTSKGKAAKSADSGPTHTEKLLRPFDRELASTALSLYGTETVENFEHRRNRFLADLNDNDYLAVFNNLTESANWEDRPKYVMVREVNQTVKRVENPLKNVIQHVIFWVSPMYEPPRPAAKEVQNGTASYIEDLTMHVVCKLPKEVRPATRAACSEMAAQFVKDLIAHIEQRHEAWQYIEKNSRNEFNKPAEHVPAIVASHPDKETCQFYRDRFTNSTWSDLLIFVYEFFEGDKTKPFRGLMRGFNVPSDSIRKLCGQRTTFGPTMATAFKSSVELLTVPSLRAQRHAGIIQACLALEATKIAYYLLRKDMKKDVIGPRTKDKDAANAKLWTWGKILRKHGIMVNPSSKNESLKGLGLINKAIKDGVESTINFDNDEENLKKDVTVNPDFKPWGMAGKPTAGKKRKLEEPTIPDDEDNPTEVAAKEAKRAKKGKGGKGAGRGRSRGGK